MRQVVSSMRVRDLSASSPQDSCFCGGGRRVLVVQDCDAGGKPECAALAALLSPGDSCLRVTAATTAAPPIEAVEVSVGKTGNILPRQPTAVLRSTLLVPHTHTHTLSLSTLPRLQLHETVPQQESKAQVRIAGVHSPPDGIARNIEPRISQKPLPTLTVRRRRGIWKCDRHRPGESIECSGRRC